MVSWMPKFLFYVSPRREIEFSALMSNLIAKVSGDR